VLKNQTISSSYRASFRCNFHQKQLAASLVAEPIFIFTKGKLEIETKIPEIQTQTKFLFFFLFGFPRHHFHKKIRLEANGRLSDF
jgi:hypothetical protein